MKRQDFYTSSYIAIFGSLWGASEIILGNLLHMLHVPFKGTIMSALGCIICLVGSSLLPIKTKLPLLSMGIIATLIRLFSFGIFKIHIFISMLIMSLFMQIAVSLLGYNLIGYITSGILVCFAPYVSTLGFLGIIMGQEAFTLYNSMLKDSTTFATIVRGSWVTIASTIVAINIIAGSLTGLTAHYLGNKLKHDIHS